MFGKISIIGCGLIGSSILRATQEQKLATKISVYDKSNKVIEYLKKNFTADICSNVSETTKDSDLNIISAPLSSYKEILLSIKSNLKEGSILTDTGSAKKEVNKIVNNLGLKNISWIASHPIAGTEYSSKLGSKVKAMSFEDHDYVLSLTSHLPHAVAYSIVRTAINNEDKFKNDVIQYSAGGLRDFTRIAASDPLMWKDIFIDNSENILKVLDNYSKNLDEIKNAIKTKDSEKLLEIFSSTKKVRKEIIEAGQDTEKPDFGRK